MNNTYFSTATFRVFTALALPVAVMMGCTDHEDVALENTESAVYSTQSIFADDAALRLAVERVNATAAAEPLVEAAGGIATLAAENNAPAADPNRVLLFATDDDKVASDDLSRLSQFAAFLTLHPHYTVQVNGHADERGTRAHNIELSARRAQQVASALESFGVPPTQIQTAGYGEDRPVAAASQWDKNRRVELEYIETVAVNSP